MDYKEIRIEDYNYNLPDERIAKYPLPLRDSSKLLEYNDGRISRHLFHELPDLLPEQSLMVFNDTKVVPARLHFKRETGAAIEIFCLRPEAPNDYNLAFQTKGRCRWKCVVGNVKRWKGDTLGFINTTNDPKAAEVDLKADLIERQGEASIVEFSWEGDVLFSDVLDICGNIPIPPYLNRDTEAIDIERYQTTYAHVRGSVAAPTAGLHFTEETLEKIASKGIDRENVCLHVGAGTFLPVKSSLVAEHPMHREPFSVKLELLEKLSGKERPLVAVGTTSVRTLESLYYVGVSIIEHGKPEEVAQWAPYERKYDYSTREALDAITGYLESNNMEQLTIGTKIIIVPGFEFRLVDYLVTNFHQPESTLLLLVSAFVGGNWKEIYEYALSNGFRFLSYGDSSFLKRAIK